MTQWIKIGVVAKAHGLRGHFFVSDRDEPIPNTCSTLKIGSSLESAQLIEVESSKAHAGRIVLKLKGFTDRDHAERLKAQSIWMESEHVECSEDEYLWTDLVDRTVLDVEGQTLGRVVEVTNFGASDIVIVEGPDGRQVDLAFVESFFDMNFSEDDQNLKLIVGADVFGELWHD